MATSAPEDLDRYVRDIERFPLLTREEEANWGRIARGANGKDHARSVLVNCNLRFVVKVAHEYKGHDVPMLDMIQEGNIGLMQAVEKFDPDRGYRLISYAVWWIRSAIQKFIMRTWSLVRVGTTHVQRMLFYKLRSTRLAMAREGFPDTPEALAERLGVRPQDITTMDLRLSARDFWLDAPLEADSETTHVDVLAQAADTLTPEEQAHVSGVREHVQTWVGAAMERLNDRERTIVNLRLMCDEPLTRQQVGIRLGLSRERVRQIEHDAVRKLRTLLLFSDLPAEQGAE